MMGMREIGYLDGGVCLMGKPASPLQGGQVFEPIENSGIACRDCAYCLEGSTANCEVYKSRYKPREVLIGGDCEFYTKARA